MAVVNNGDYKFISGQSQSPPINMGGDSLEMRRNLVNNSVLLHRPSFINNFLIAKLNYAAS